MSLMRCMNSSIPGDPYESPRPCQMTNGRLGGSTVGFRGVERAYVAVDSRAQLKANKRMAEGTQERKSELGGRGATLREGYSLCFGAATAVIDTVQVTWTGDVSSLQYAY